MKEKQEPVSFTPDLMAEDACANFWLKQVTVRLRREIAWIWNERGILPDLQNGPLPPFSEKLPTILDQVRFQEDKLRFYEEDICARYLTEQLEVHFSAHEMKGLQGSFGWLVESLQLDDASSFLLALCLAPSFDNTVGSVMASCLNDPNKTQPTLGLLQKLWDNPEQVMQLSDVSHPLYRYGIIRIGNGAAKAIEWDTSLSISSMVAYQLLFPDLTLHHCLAECNHSVFDSHSLSDSAQLIAARLRANQRQDLQIIPVYGPERGDHLALSRAMAELNGAMLVELKELLRFSDAPHFLHSIIVLCWLRGVDLFLPAHVIKESSQFMGKNASMMWNSLPALPIHLYVALTDKDEKKALPERWILPVVETPDFDYHERRNAWKQYLESENALSEEDISECARRFRYQRQTIKSIADGLNSFSSAIERQNLFSACRCELAVNMDGLAQKVEPRFDSEELILPPKQKRQFLDITQAMSSLATVHYDWGTGKAWNEVGIAVLFAGAPGTGKTMASEILARTLNLPMFRIDLSQVINKYIGETEKNLKRLFDAADASDMILFFDEADSLFGRRSEVRDSHDRFANVEISYLLERMERFKGLAILATNRKKDLDEAFLRRLRYVVDFPLPGEVERKRIWEQFVPRNVETKDMNFDFLARQFPLSGGHIRSVVLNACLLSASRMQEGRNGSSHRLYMEDVMIAVKREFDKLGRSISYEKFGPYASVVHEVEEKG
ncbi:MAG: ATP-binding protein [Verrucomicrobiota bacterium]